MEDINEAFVSARDEIEYAKEVRGEVHVRMLLCAWTCGAPAAPEREGHAPSRTARRSTSMRRMRQRRLQLLRRWTSSRRCWPRWTSRRRTGCSAAWA